MKPLDAIFKGVGFLTSIAGSSIEFIGERVRKWGEDLLSRISKNEVENSGHDSYYSNIETLEIINAEFVELEKKQKYDGGLSKRDQDKLEELNCMREQEFEQYQKTQVVESAIEQVSNHDTYESSLVTSEKVHILQYQMGQIVLEKKCTCCGKPMFLQHRNRPDGSAFILSDFFWSCTGYYENNTINQCRARQNFAYRDIGLLHKVNVPELIIKNSDLSIIFAQRSIQQIITKRVKDYISERDIDILCKIHYIPMILCEKKNHNGSVLDMYHLKCPNHSCGQTIKLKSAAQLAAFLRRKEGKGILD